MIRLCIICEGPTEVEFVNRCLEPYLQPYGIMTYGTLLAAKSGRHRGGRVSVERLAKKMALHYYEADRISTLVDFYGFSDRAGRSPDQLEAVIAQAVGSIIRDYDPRYVLPYVQRHEFEGLLFSDPAAFAWVGDGWNSQVEEALTAVAQAFPTPEDINDGPQTAPSKRLLKIFPPGTYSKLEHGPLIAEAIGIETMRQTCPRFATWIARLQAWGA